MKYEVLKPFSLNPGRAEISAIGSKLVVLDEARAADLIRSGMIAAEGTPLTDEEQAKIDADAAAAPAVGSVTAKSIAKAPSNKDAAPQREVK